MNFTLIGHEYEEGCQSPFPIVRDDVYGNIHTLYDDIQVRTITLHTCVPSVTRRCLELTWDLTLFNCWDYMTLFMTPQGPAMLVGDLPDKSLTRDVKLVEDVECECDLCDCFGQGACVEHDNNCEHCREGRDGLCDTLADI